MTGGTLNFITFNQDYSCLAVGTSKGFRFYHTDPFSKIFSSDEGNVSIIEMLFSTSLVALILTPRQLEIQNTKVDQPSQYRQCLPPRELRLTPSTNPESFRHLRTYLPIRRPSCPLEP